jgi:drug/metabolite transporter (DMT)-like permease
MPKISSRTATLYLLLVSLIWGGTFPFIRDSVQYISPAGFVAIRFSLAALLFLPLAIPRFKNTRLPLLVAGIVLGLLTGIGYFAQTAGLQTIGSAQSAFITALSVILIPFFAPFFGLGRPHFLEVLCAIGCLIGVYILTGAHLTISPAIITAEGLTFVCAITTALSIVYLQKISSQIDDYRLFIFYQILFSAFIPLGIFMHSGHATIHCQPILIIGLLYCIFLSTALPIYLQTKYQRYTTPTRTGIIFTLEPVFASLFAFLFNGEAVTRSLLIGGGMILISLLVSEVKIKR